MAAEHPDWESVLDYVEGRPAPGPANELERLQSHLKECPACARLAERAARLLARLEMARHQLPDPLQIEAGTASIRAELQRWGWPRAALAAAGWISAAVGALEEASAELLEDSWAASPALRAAAVEDRPRMLLFETQAFSITLALQPRPGDGALRIRGQVTPLAAPSLPTGGVAMVRWGDHQELAALSDHGEFSLVCPGRVDGLPELAVAVGESLVRVDLHSAR